MRIIKCLMLAALVAGVGGSQSSATAAGGSRLSRPPMVGRVAPRPPQKGQSDMPTLNWMGREKATKPVKEVVMKILREDRDLSYGGILDAETQRRREGEGVITGALPKTPKNSNSETSSKKSSDPLRLCVSALKKETEQHERLCVENNNADNILVHGDNLEALKALLPFYAGEVKCIYIDPPYNTGSAFEHYDDNLEHSTWLNMMYPRLKLLREFMREDGSIWISIDDREGAYLRVICDEIFGRQNFVSNISWQRTYSTRNDAKGIVNEVEHHRSFSLPLSHDSFYPDFVGELTDGRLFAVEYKGEHLRNAKDTLEKDAIGRLWASRSGGKCLYVTVYKSECGLDVRGQLDKLFGENT